MFIFRVEHKREICLSAFYGKNGESYTGHGPQRPLNSKCDNFDYDLRPRFGERLSPPSYIMEYERCAVIAAYFDEWIGDQFGEDYDLNLGTDWHIVSYWVEDSDQDVSWRFTEGQIVFNPAFAINMGPVEVEEVYEMVNVYA